MDRISKKELETALGSNITDSMFNEVSGYARKKQEYIYQHGGSKVVLEHWYLVKLAEEYARNLAFSKFTINLCEVIYNTGKEYLDETGTQ